jgi:hypothetical protein
MFYKMFIYNENLLVSFMRKSDECLYFKDTGHTIFGTMHFHLWYLPLFHILTDSIAVVNRIFEPIRPNSLHFPRYNTVLYRKGKTIYTLSVTELHRGDSVYDIVGL